jgi:ATP-dependent Clp protease ATP-binding subunit ClpA
MCSESYEPEEVKFDDAYVHIHHIAEYEAKNQGWPRIKPSHVLIALLEVGTRFEPKEIEFGQEMLSFYSLRHLHNLFRGCKLYEYHRSEIVKEVRNEIGNGSGCPGKPEDSEEYRKIIDHAMEIAKSYRYKNICLSHLLLALLESGYTAWPERFVTRGRLIHDVKENIPKGEVEKILPSLTEIVGLPQGEESWIEKNIYRDFTEDAIKGRLPTIIGVEDLSTEVLEYARIGGQTSAVLLTGEPGVGKTAMVEAAAQLEVQKARQENREPRRIVQVTVATLSSGCRYVGDFEKRMNSFLKEVEGNKNIVIFIDEIHTLVGSGRGEGMVLDATHIFLVALGGANLQLIGATTETEYEGFLKEKRRPFVERFKRISVQQPTKEKMKQILNGRKREKETYHGLAINDDALNLCLEGAYSLSGRMPRQALLVLDEACRCAKKSGRAAVSGLDVLEALSVRCNLQRLVLEEEFFQNGFLRKVMGEYLNKNVFGQSKAISNICRIFSTYIRSKLRGRNPCVFIFIGPKNVGKTQTIRSIANFLSRERGECITVDMNRYSGSEGLREIRGAPPGTVGYGEIPDWMRKLERNPCSVVLLKNFQNCTWELLDFVASMVKNGKLERSDGNTIDMRGCIIILKLEMDLGGEKALFGFHPPKGEADIGEQEIKAILGEQFTDIPIVAFRSIDLYVQKKILQDRIKEKLEMSCYKFRLDISEQALEYVAQKVWAFSGNANLEKVVNEEIIGPILERNLETTEKPIKVDLENGQLIFSSNG